jgi:dUTP pyrophosphatase
MNLLLIVTCAFITLLINWLKDSPIKVNAIASNQLPKRQKDGDAGYDIRYNGPHKLVSPGQTVLLPTGIKLEIPKGYEAQVRGRSGLAFKHGLFAHVGTIDSNYRGDIGVILHNASSKPYVVSNDERIGQLIFAKVETFKFNKVEELTSTDRGEKGFGSSGKTK